MLRPSRMCRIDCLIPKEYEDKLTLSLQRRGSVEVEETRQKTKPGFMVEGESASDNLKKIDAYKGEIKRLIESFKPYQDKTGFLEGLMGVGGRKKENTHPTDSKALFTLIEEYLAGEGVWVRKLFDEKKKAEETIKQSEHELRKYGAYAKTQTSTRQLGESRLLYTLLGSIKTRKLPELTSKLNKKFRTKYILDLHPEAKSETPLTLTVSRQEKEDLKQLLKKTPLTLVEFPDIGRIDQWLAEKKQGVQETRRRLGELDKQLRGLSADHLPKLYLILELLENEENRNKTLTLCQNTDKTTVLRLWTPRRECEKTITQIKKSTENLCALEVESNPKNAPILLENPQILSSFELLTRLFALPRYNQIDPTLIIAPTFSIFFGLMLTDFFYGALLVTGSYLILCKYGDQSTGLRDLTIIFMACGVSSMFFGVLTGSYLGDFFGTYLYGGKPQDIALWLDPLHGSNTITLLVVACAGGFLHIYLGYLLGALDNIRAGNLKDALTKNLSWYVFAFGIILTALTQYPAANPMLPETLTLPSIALTSLGLILLFWGRGFIFLIEIISLVGSTLSYARLIALGLTTAGIALAFNFLSNIALQTPYVGVILAAVIFILGHIINILINTLGAFVHSLRLHYVEFFGTFYEGGGREFNPLEFKKKYTL
ncbi:MAG: hypothetical protein GF334_05790 [Candidatus Altiarchaeales archaeon]|nr:hypothetical protein [Candidatus Altiarchaeales archaeon]